MKGSVGVYCSRYYTRPYVEPFHRSYSLQIRDLKTQYLFPSLPHFDQFTQLIPLLPWIKWAGLLNP